jgi:hypothetical protein
MHEQAPQVAVAPLGNTSDAGLPATPGLARYEPEPGGNLTAIAKVMSVAQGGYQRRRVQRPNAVHLLQALTHVQIAADAREPLRHLCNGRIEYAEFMRQALEQLATGAREAIVGICQGARQAVASAGEPLGDHDAHPPGAGPGCD